MNGLLKFSLAMSVAFFAVSSEGRAEDVKVGVIYDATGPVATQSVPYAKGVQAAIRSINLNGGINGKQITALVEDYGYQIPRAFTAYKKLKGAGVVAIQGFGSGDTEALIETVARDKMPWFSASYAANLADPSHAPYNYFAGVDYSSQVRAGLKHIADNWTDATRRPTFAIIYTDNAFGKSVLPAIESYAAELKIEVVGKEVVNPGALDAVSAVTRLKDLKPDFVWLQQIASTVAPIVRDAKKVGLETNFYGGVWTYDPNLIELAGPAIEGLVSVQIAALSARGLPAEEAVKAAAENPSDIDDHNFLRGWAAMIALGDGMKAADAAGNLTGEGIKTALDSGTPIDVGGLMAPLVYSATDHRSSDTTYLYRIENQKPVLLKEVTLERRADWLGK
jgi:branched-chain amino acid transport system substrate-binding protein